MVRRHNDGDTRSRASPRLPPHPPWPPLRKEGKRLVVATGERDRSVTFFPPLAKGGPGGVVPAQSVTGPPKCTGAGLGTICYPTESAPEGCFRIFFGSTSGYPVTARLAGTLGLALDCLGTPKAASRGEDSASTRGSTGTTRPGGDPGRISPRPLRSTTFNQDPGSKLKDVDSHVRSFRRARQRITR